MSETFFFFLFSDLSYYRPHWERKENENKNMRFVGKNKKGSLIFKGKNNLVEINTRGRIS